MPLQLCHLGNGWVPPDHHLVTGVAMAGDQLPVLRAQGKAAHLPSQVHNVDCRWLRLRLNSTASHTCQQYLPRQPGVLACQGHQATAFTAAWWSVRVCMEVAPV